MGPSRKAILAASVVLGLMFLTAAEPAPEPARKPLGTWEHKVADNLIRLQFTPDLLTVHIEGGATRIDLKADYGVTRNGTVFGILTQVEKDGADSPNAGDLFSFKVEFTKDKLTLSELKPDGDQARALLHGNYLLVPEKK